MPEIPNIPREPGEGPISGERIPPRRPPVQNPGQGTPPRRAPGTPSGRPQGPQGLPPRRRPPAGAPGQAAPRRVPVQRAPGQPGTPGQNPEPRERRTPSTGQSVPPRRRNPAPSGTRQRPGTGGRFSGNGKPPRRTSGKKSGGPNLPLILIIALLLVGSIVMLVLCLSLTGSDGETGPGPATHDRIELSEKPPVEKPQKPSSNSETTPAETEPEPDQVVATAKFTATGDLLIHKSIINGTSAVNLGDQGYNFDSIFKFLGGYTDAADYAVANLETTLFGPGKPYSGNPKFNTPDELVDSAKKAGFDMLLTANNHCNDTDLDGVLRTLKVIREKGLATLGTNLDDEEEKYVIQEVNGIKIGMLCYTYEDSRDPNQVTFNYNPLPAKAKNLVCSFPKFQDAKSREPFYTALESQISEMKEKGAEAIVLFVHWGEEYHLQASQDQKSMAQKFCDMGVDLIVGGHPHVVQPIELLTSTADPGHKTVCLYSMGNAVSNQRKEEMTKSCPTGHTEDGMLFDFTFEKLSSGEVRLANVDVIPIWVDMHSNADGKREYNILPLEDARRQDWQTMFGIDAAKMDLLSASYQRTMDIVGPGLEASNAWLSGEAS